MAILLPKKYFNRVGIYGTYSTGTPGTITLGAAITGHKSFPITLTSGDIFDLLVKKDDNNWYIVTGTWVEGAPSYIEVDLTSSSSYNGSISDSDVVEVYIINSSESILEQRNPLSNTPIGFIYENTTLDTTYFGNTLSTIYNSVLCFTDDGSFTITLGNTDTYYSVLIGRIGSNTLTISPDTGNGITLDGSSSSLTITATNKFIFLVSGGEDLNWTSLTSV